MRNAVPDFIALAFMLAAMLLLYCVLCPPAYAETFEIVCTAKDEIHFLAFVCAIVGALVISTAWAATDVFRFARRRRV
jgi:hypothetical protein